MTNQGSPISATKAIDMNELIWKIREGEIKCYAWNTSTSSWEKLTKGLISVSGQPVKVSGQVVYVSGQPVKVSGQAVKVSGQTVIGKVSGQVVYVSGQPVKVSGQVVQVSGQTVESKISGQTVGIAAPTSIENGQTVISGTNLSGATPVQVGSAVCVSVTVKALTGNSGDVYVGNSNVSSDKGLPLTPGEQVSLDIDNVNKVYATSEVDGDKVGWASVN